MGPGFSVIYAIRDAQMTYSPIRPRALADLRLDSRPDIIADPSNFAYLMTTHKLLPCGYSTQSSRLVIGEKAYKMNVSYVYHGDVNNIAQVEISFACNARSTHKHEVKEAIKWLISSLQNAVAETKIGRA